MKGHIRQRGKGTWAIVIDIGRDANGKRRQKWHTVHGSKKAAERELARLLNEINTGGYVEPTQLTVREYLERWLRDYAEHNVAAKTGERYTDLIRKHIAPSLGHYRLSKLHPLHIQDFYAQALESGRMDGKGGLSAQTVLHMHRVLRTALNQAVKWQLLARNPADAVSPPRPQHKEMRALDEQETAKLLRAFARSTLHVPVLVAVTSGVRRGELLGLRWSDIDFKTAILSVRQSLEQTRKGVAFKQPKTSKSGRAIALPPLTVEALREHRASQAEHRLKLGPVYENLDLVFPRDDGRPWAPDGFTSTFAALVRRSGLPHVRFHDLRHTHATQLLRQGVHPKIVSERLGHSTVGITLDVYSHVLPGMQDEAAKGVDAALRAAIQKAADTD